MNFELEKLWKQTFTDSYTNTKYIYTVITSKQTNKQKKSKMRKFQQKKINTTITVCESCEESI